MPLWFWRLLDERRHRADPGRPRRDIPHATMLLLDALDGALDVADRQRHTMQQQQTKARELIQRAQRGDI